MPNLFATLSLLAVYMVLMYWVIKRYQSRVVVRNVAAGKDSPYPLARSTHIVLDIVHALAFFTAVVWPPIWLFLAVTQHNNPSLGMNLHTGFTLDPVRLPPLSELVTGNKLIHGSMEFTADAFNMMQWFLYFVGKEVSALVALFVIFHLRNIFASICNADAISMANALRMRWIGSAIVAIFFMAPLWYSFVWSLIVPAIDLSASGLSLTVPFELNFRILLLGIAVIVMAGLLKEAVQLQDEQRLTI